MGRIDRTELGHRQQMVMKCVWELGGQATVPQMVEQMEKKYGAKLSNQGMNTMVLMLQEKGMLRRRRKIHQAFIYEAAITEEEFRLQELKRVQRLTFDGSAKAMVLAMLETDLSESDLDEVRQLLDQK